MRSRAGILLAGLCALASRGLAAQESVVRAPIDSGTLIRMHPATGAPVRGRLFQPLGPTSSLVRFCRYPAPPCTNPTDSSAIQRLPVTSIVRLEVQRGNRWEHGAAIGGLIGGVLGSLLGSLANGLCDSTSCGPSTGEYVFLGAIGVGAFGALIGSGSPKWG